MLGNIWRAAIAAAPVRFWAMVGAAIALTALAAVLIWIVWAGGWHNQQPRQLDILGKALWLDLGMLGLIVLALTMQHLSAKGAWGSVDVGGGGEDTDKGAG